MKYIGKSLRIAAATAAIFLTAATILQAQPVNPIPFSLKVGPMAGLTLPQGDLDESFNGGYHIGGLAWLTFGQFGGRAEANYHKMETPDVTFGAARINGDVKQSGFLVSGTYDVIPAPIIRPYVIIGVGSYKYESKISDSVTEITVESEFSGFAVAGGIGAKVNISKVSLFLEGRYLRISIDEGTANSMLVSGGLLFAVI